MTAATPYTPKEFADQLGGKRSAKWVRQQCRLFIRSRGRRGIKTATKSAPYLIPQGELLKFCSGLGP
jgi:hypothetical protein